MQDYIFVAVILLMDIILIIKKHWIKFFVQRDQTKALESEMMDKNY